MRFASNSTRETELQKMIDCARKGGGGGVTTCAHHIRTQTREITHLVDLQLREECVETVHLLALLNEGIVLGNALERQLLIHRGGKGWGGRR